MRADQYAILGHLQILLDIISALFDGQLVGSLRMLRRVGRSAPMSDEEWFGTRVGRSVLGSASQAVHEKKENRQE